MKNPLSLAEFRHFWEFKHRVTLGFLAWVTLVVGSLCVYGLVGRSSCMTCTLILCLVSATDVVRYRMVATREALPVTLNTEFAAALREFLAIPGITLLYGLVYFRKEDHE